MLGIPISYFDLLHVWEASRASPVLTARRDERYGVIRFSNYRAPVPTTLSQTTADGMLELRATRILQRWVG